VGACSASLVPGANLHVARAADGSFAVGPLSGCAALDGLDPQARVGLGVVAHAGSALRSLALTRNPP
jgi:hypothetical protein